MTTSWWQLVGGKREAGEDEGGGADTTLKTKNPHVDVGNSVPD